MSAAELFRDTGSHTPQFTLAGLHTIGRVVDVYDGDTLKIVIPYAGSMWKFNVRLYGIDTAELTSKLAENKERAVRARNRIIELASGITPLPSSCSTKKGVCHLFDQNMSIVRVICIDMDKYGRLLANVYRGDDELSFSETLLNERLAYAYSGETKLTEAQQATEMSIRKEATEL